MSKDLNINATHVAIPISSVKVISLLPVILEITSPNPIPDTLELWINNKELPETVFSKVTDIMVHAMVPLFRLTSPINTLALYTTEKVLSTRDLVLGKTSVDEGDKIVQQVAKFLYTTPGTDVFVPNGLGLLTISTKRISDAAGLIAMLKPGLKQFVKAYNAVATSVDAQIKQIDVQNIIWSDDGFSANIIVVLLNKASKEFTIFSTRNV